ncbi:NAD-dependent epimerase/dehydratase family protein [Pedobacter hartonius]|uniref:Nucleoside-diphosphate-sugar epimerase n=1 Tax=Pedobacter hartonius TaxID=425514 RepID=A0A1H4FQU6_9SPHI|nr:NAD-dependent epimerase/dehydratase family protein [Pedobacter hartonius]SEA99665.1 Nucleoside-diphosphate-sugar epimerase [Pedobacter hartonius]
MHVIITGASGFVGQNLVRYLSNITSLNLVPLDLRKHSNDISYANVIVHLAGKAHDLRKSANPDEYYQINYELTKDLYDKFLKSNASKFIFISSVKAVADSLDGIMDEDIIAFPHTHYGKSKLLAEEYIIQQPLPSGKSYFILRPCMIHGPGNKGNLNLLYKFVAKGIPYPLASFENKRSFLSIENLCFILKELIERDDILSGIYNVADDQVLSTKEVVVLLSKVLNRSPQLLHIPVKMVVGLAKIGDFLRLPLNSERLGKLTENYVVSNRKILAALGKSLPVSSDDGILETARGFNNSI